MLCAYNINVFGFGRTHFGVFNWMAVDQDPSFQKRLKWIGECAQIAHFRLHHFDYRKGNVSRYFVEVFSIYIAKQFPYGWSWDSMDLAHPTCYYLGSYPNFWNVPNKRIVYAHDLMTAAAFPMGNEPVIPRFFGKPVSAEQMLEVFARGESANEYISKDEKDEWNSLETDYGKENLINYLYPERMDMAARPAFFASPHGPGTDIDEALTKMSFFYKKEDVIQWLRQKYALAERTQSFNACIKQAYPKPEKEPQYKILDPQGAKDFPGIPIDQMQLPAPTGQSVPRPPPKQMIIRLLFAFSIINVSSLNGYSLILNVEEVKD